MHFFPNFFDGIFIAALKTFAENDCGKQLLTCYKHTSFALEFFAELLYNKNKYVFRYMGNRK